MPTEPDHNAAVAAWLEKHARLTSPDSLYHQFRLTFNGIWQRAKQALGEVTLTAIGVRALLVAAERYPLLLPLSLDPNGICQSELPAQETAATPEEVRAATAYALTEFLTVLGSLTAEILTPALHAELRVDQDQKEGKS